jgi:hypothetical protein
VLFESHQTRQGPEYSERLVHLLAVRPAA